MKSLSVIIPTWDYQRALSLVRRLTHLELDARKTYVEYILVLPEIETAYDLQPDLSEWLDIEGPSELKVRVTADYLSPVEAMAIGAQRASTESSILVFLHDDVLIEQQGWEQVIADHFATHPRCGLVGFGGGIGFADIDIYKVPYDYRQLARVDFVSNMREAESHGRRVSEPVRVAALDGFALIVTREFYERAGQRSERVFQPGQIWSAWKSCLIDGVPYHMYDAWLSCRAAELGYETWMLPIACHHQGGQTSVSRQTEYAQVVSRLGYASAEDLYAKGHEAIYKRFAGVLPIRVGSTQ